MSVFKRIQEAIEFVWEGAVRIFGPSRDAYPVTGVQPFEGEPYDEGRNAID